MFEDLSVYNYEQFLSHFIRGAVENFVSNSKWYSLNRGVCEGMLIGGYTLDFALLINSHSYKFNSREKYVLFLEDHEKCNNIACVSALISHIEQSCS